ncbi:MAG: alpha-L-rhamnosidase N-terminal domain-containing protein [Lentisphaeria bacterium]|nr:alpha-L-rhamnosidase N-terminal domain-containing protein [Lentisphaeria bacterium]
MSEKTTEHGPDGSWIWLDTADRRNNRRVFFRREFMLPESPDFIKLEVSALPFYHVYLNGEHVGYGPAAATHSNCYIDSYDVTQYLSPGINTLALVVMDQKMPNWHSHPYPPRLWCRLFINGEAAITSGPDWKVLPADCSDLCQPFCHYGMDKVEKIDLEREPVNWMLNGFDDSRWQRASVHAAFHASSPKPSFANTAPYMWMESDAFESVRSGTYSGNFASAFYSYENFDQLTPGNYAAEAFAYSPVDADVRMDISSDDPFIVFCNDNPVASGSRSRRLDEFEQPHSPRTGDDVLVSVTIRLNQGWNRFLCFQEAAEDSMGMMLLFPGTQKDALVFRREPDMESLSGWKLFGPLRTPLSFSSPSFSMENRRDTVGFLPLEDHINDISAYLANCDFTVRRTGGITGLREGEFAVYDLGEFRYGFPILDIGGNAGDVVDITCGLRMAGEAVQSIGPLGRMTDTLILRGGNNSWIRLVPRGARYVMISVRKAAGAVTPILRFSSVASELGAGSEFISSDETCNQIWSLAVNSLRQCANRNIIDDPCGRRCQALPEAYCYSRTLNFLFGGQKITERALREFADAQLENGMIMKIVPSGVYSYSPDTALLWILWLEDHWIHTGSRAMLEEMVPYMDRLLAFFRNIPPAGDVLLPSGRAGYCAFLNERRTLTERGAFIPLNALYYRVLMAAARLYGALNQDPRDLCLEIAARLKADIERLARDPETGVYADYFDGQRSAECSFRTNIMVLNSGLVDDTGEARRILEKFSAPDLLMHEISSPFFTFVLETFASFGRQDLAFAALRSGCRFNRERMDIYESGYNPHVFNIIAADFLIREVLGIRASAPGFTQVYFNPACSLLTEAKCRIPAGKGRIAVEWKVDGHNIHAKIDSGSTLDVLPIIPPKFGATFELGNYVNLLDPNS